MRGFRYEVGGGGDFLKNRKAIGFLSNTGPDLLKITKLPNGQPEILTAHKH